MLAFLQSSSGNPSSSSVHDAFRSITRLISIIQQAPFSNLTPELPVEEGRQELKLSVAFAILAALEHEVVAVMAKPTYDGLEVIVCPNSLHDTDQTSLQQLGDKVLDFVFTGNARRKDSDSKTDHPTFISTSPPPGLSKRSSSEELERYVEKLFLSKIKAPYLHFPLHQHLDVLRQLLTVEANASQIMKHMLHYVVATSYVKIHNRMKKGSSIAYLETLTTISTENLDPLVHLSNRKDQPFIIYLSGFQQEWQDRFPKLYLVGTRHAKPTTEVTRRCELYNDDTRHEFHDLLTMCLQGFASGLQKLVDIRQSADKASESSEDAKGRFAVYATFVARHGQCLSNLARTNAIQLHLCAILSRYPGHGLAIASTLKSMPESYDNQTVPGEEDTTIEPLPTDTDMPPLVKLYLDWLKLIIAEFDAANVLINRFVVQGQRSSISIKVMKPLSTDDTTLPWKDLIQPSFIIDTLVDGISNEQLLQYLTNIHSAVEPALAWLNRFTECWMSCGAKGDTRKMAKIIKEQQETTPMKMYQAGMHQEDIWQFWLQAPEEPLLLLPDWAPMLYDLFNAFSGWCVNKQLQILKDKISGHIDSLKASYRFYEKIACTNCTVNFEARIHCEAGLASLVSVAQTRPGLDVKVDDRDEKLVDLIKGLGNVIGVSKRCCPPCASLLKHMSPPKGNFITRGAHNTVTVCSLPQLLPVGLMQQMNLKFGAMLRDELVALIKAPESHRKRAVSTSSSGRSSSSGEQEEEVPVIVDWPL